MIRAWIWRSLRLLLIFCALCSAGLAVLLAFGAVPEAGRTSVSPEFGEFRNQWFVSFIIANTLVLLAIRIAAGWTRMLLATVLVIVWAEGIAPGYQLYEHEKHSLTLYWRR